MKTTRLLFLGILGLFSAFTNLQAQSATGYATSSVTSFGSGSGVTTVSTSGSSFFGYQAGNTITATTANARNSFFGSQAGKNISSGTNNTLMGFSAGLGGILSSANSYFGSFSGNNNLGSNNSALGYYGLSTYSSTVCSQNTALGYMAGSNLASGSYNVFLGHNSGANANGSNNVLIGNNSGSSPYPGASGSIGSGNVLIGDNSGYNLALSNKLFIDNTSTSTPLIWGDFTNDQLKLNGKVGIGAVGAFPTTAGGVSVSSYRLFVTGGILADEMRVMLSASGTWPDYVFYKDYDLKPLAEVEKFINEKGHLPNVPSAAQVKEDGIALGEMAKIQQEKIEELTLYIIQQSKEIEALKAAMKLLADKK